MVLLATVPFGRLNHEHKANIRTAVEDIVFECLDSNESGWDQLAGIG
jgi:hypothetical protein